MSFFEELKRRNVVRVGLAYLLVSWMVLQVADVAFGVLQMPGWGLTMVATVLAIGFIPALIFSWIFELTPDGLRRDDGQASTQPRGRLDIVMAGMLAGILGLLAWQQFGPESIGKSSVDQPTDTAPPPSSATPAPGAASTSPAVGPGFGEREVAGSIAVLPFDDRSAEGANQAFADGLADTILHSLGQIDALRVIARNSSFAYSAENVDVREVGEALDVAHVLLGNVQRQGDRIRVIAQLIQTADAGLAWSKTYTREAEDLFALQDEIATDVAAELQVSFDPLDSDPLETDNLLAFNLVQLARSRIFEGAVQAALGSGKEPTEAIDLIREAIDLDPDYLGAWESLAQIYDFAALQGPGVGNFQRNVERLRETVENMETIAPGHSATLQARASYEWRRWNALAARDAARAALDRNPNAAAAWRTLGLATGRLGDPARAVLYFERARELDPAQPYVYRMLGNAAVRTGDLDAALAYRREAIRRAPEALPFRDDLIEFQARTEGRFDLAVASALAAFSAFDAPGPLQRTVAMILLELGAPMEAEQWLDRAASNMAEPESLDWPRSYILVYTGRNEEAEALVAEMIERASGGDAGVWRYSEFPRVRICLRERDFDCVDDVMRRLYPAFEDPDLRIAESRIGRIWAANTHMLLALVDQRAGRTNDATIRCRDVLENAATWPIGGNTYGRNMIDAQCHAILGDQSAMLSSLQAYLDVDEDAWFAPFTGANYLPDSAFFEAYRDLPEFKRIAAEHDRRREKQLAATRALLAAFEAGEPLPASGILPP